MSDDIKAKDDSREDATESAESTESAEPADAVGLDDTPYESTNNSREETRAIMEASSPDDVDKDLLETIEEERQERLDPDNRPDNAEVDNTQRTFIPEEARFEDSDISENDAQDGIGQKEPDPEAQAGSASDVKDDAQDDAQDDASPDTDEEGEAAAQEAESDASTGPRPSSDDAAPGRHKA
ncbi:hypothetical protein [Nocardioides marmoribigeumensis]|uniref:Uncharacterized protein n=1 Tax=Nocardioides marmoribigeumensis TaxID=433649 RepID=A0ABU2BZ04_9ACTN|nr:hypothetical protein [Nocardioides marmoribigeumensis]MDR7363633.1 hypothetical protein [Nocardioides marmoribigeumensis]